MPKKITFELSDEQIEKLKKYIEKVKKFNFLNIAEKLNSEDHDGICKNIVLSIINGPAFDNLFNMDNFKDLIKNSPLGDLFDEFKNSKKEENNETKKDSDKNGDKLKS